MTRTPVRPFRSRDWFDAPGRSDMTALYLERFMNYGITADELRCGKPIIGIAQSFPIMAASLGLAVSYSFYAVSAVISFFLVQKFIHETKGKELEEMQG